MHTYHQQGYSMVMVNSSQQQCMCLPHVKTHLQYVVMTYMTQPTHISLMWLSYEHPSKSLSSLPLIGIYLFQWQWWDSWRNCLHWLLCSLQMTRAMMMMANPRCPVDGLDGRIYGPRCPSSAQNALSLGRSLSLSLLYWSYSSQVHNFHIPGTSLDRKEI